MPRTSCARNLVVPRRAGIAALYLVLILAVLAGFVSLAVDFGRVQLAKSELQAAADAAARAAAVGLAGGAEQARADAIAIAAANRCDNQPVTLDGSDIELGEWDGETRRFIPLSGYAADGASAVRITARRTAARGNAVPLIFAGMVGRTQCDVTATAIATLSASPSASFIGLNGITVKNSATFASYDSATGKLPEEAVIDSGGAVGSNGPITGGNNGHVYGNASLGPSAMIESGFEVTGTASRLAGPIDPPELPDWSPGTNPGGVPRDYAISRDVTLPGGSYWFTSLSIDGTLRFSGPATVYVNGNITLDGSLLAWQNVPANLRIYQLGESRTFGDSRSNSLLILATIQAPGANFVAKNRVVFGGSAVFASITTRNSALFACDRALRSSSGGSSIATVH